MRLGYLWTGVLCTSLVIGPAGPAAAGGDAAAGFIGGLIGGVLLNEAARNNQPRTVVRTAPAQPKPAVNTYERERNREVQNALNYFGYPVGTPDGVLGSRSRAAVSQYQALLGYPASGHLTEMERTILVGAHQRAQIGGPQVSQAIANHPQGMRGLLIAQRDQMLGLPADNDEAQVANTYGGLPPVVAAAVEEIARNSGIEPQQLVQRAGFVQMVDINADGRTDYLLDTSVTGSRFWCDGAACTVRVFASIPSGYQRNDFQLAGATPASFSCQQGACVIAPQAATVVAAAPVIPAPAPALPPAVAVAMPNFAAPQPAVPSFAAALPEPGRNAFCAPILAQGPDRLQTVAAMNDPTLALGQQFCAASTEARDHGAALAAQIKGFTPEQIAGQCADYAALLADRVTSLPTTPRDDQIAAVSGFVKGSGMTDAQAAATAKICLSVGYDDDAAEVALASAMVLAATGDMAYAELVGHHLFTGIGTEARADLALEWYEAAIRAAEVGQPPVFAAGGSDRLQLIRKAAMALNGRADAGVTAIPVSAPGGFAAAAAQAVAAGGTSAP